MHNRQETKGETRVYVASDMVTDYPFKLQKPSTKSMKVRESSDVYIADSGIGDDTTNRDVIRWATEYNADYVIPCDVLHDFESTTNNVYQFLDIYEWYECDATPLIPVQCDPDNGKWHTDHLPQLPNTNNYVLGGMALPEISTREKINSIREFRNKVGEDAYVHGLGVGGGMEFVSKVAGEGLLDSIDCSTPEQSAMFGCILDKRLRHKEIMEFNGGEGRTLRVQPLAQLNSFQLQDVWDRESKHHGLKQYQN